ncbi:MAG: Na+/H+ antiporter NhaA, partial [Bacteroidota bacterium]|nr:Na+/H+ antiporter NhaA [Bacteroidota bacterium]
GIGFTMSIFINLLAFSDADIIDSSKIATIIASVLAGTIGFVWLKATLGNSKPPDAIA